MQLLVYDGSFEGFLTAVFEVYEYKFADVQFYAQQNYQETIFGATHEVYTNEVKALRVWNGLEQRVSKNALNQLYKTFLSEKAAIENMLLAYIQYAFKNTGTI